VGRSNPDLTTTKEEPAAWEKSENTLLLYLRHLSIYVHKKAQKVSCKVNYACLEGDAVSAEIGLVPGQGQALGDY